MFQLLIKQILEEEDHIKEKMLKVASFLLLFSSSCQVSGPIHPDHADCCPRDNIYRSCARTKQEIKDWFHTSFISFLSQAWVCASCITNHCDARYTSSSFLCFRAGQPPIMAAPYRVLRTWGHKWTEDLDDAGGGSGGSSLEPTLLSLLSWQAEKWCPQSFPPFRPKNDY